MMTIMSCNSVSVSSKTSGQAMSSPGRMHRHGNAGVRTWFWPFVLLLNGLTYSSGLKHRCPNLCAAAPCTALSDGRHSQFAGSTKNTFRQVLRDFLYLFVCPSLGVCHGSVLHRRSPHAYKGIDTLISLRSKTFWRSFPNVALSLPIRLRCLKY